MTLLRCPQVSPTHLRGLLGTFNQLTITVGCLAALVVNELLPAERWRWVMAMGVLQTFCLLLGMALVCPESPRWLVHEGHHGEAAEAAEWLWGAGAGEMLEVTHSTLPRSPFTAAAVRSCAQPAHDAAPTDGLQGLPLTIHGRFGSGVRWRVDDTPDCKPPSYCPQYIDEGL